MSVVYMFPGQSSRDEGMLPRALALAPAENRRLVEQASDRLGRDLIRHYHADNERMFACNRDVQVGVFLTNHLFLNALELAGVRADRSLGLSLGEYNHLVHIGAIDFLDALALVDQRGACYDRGPEGVMASVFPIELEQLEAAVAWARDVGVVEIANLNSPTQHVIAGEEAAVEATIDRLYAQAFVQAVYVEQRCPMHSSIFAPVAGELRPFLDAAPFHLPLLPYLPNVDAHFLLLATPSAIAQTLERHVYSAVRWRQSIDFLLAREPEPLFVEVGPRAVLHNLLRSGWPDTARLKTDSPDGGRSAFDAAVDQLTVIAVGRPVAGSLR